MDHVPEPLNLLGPKEYFRFEGFASLLDEINKQEHKPLVNYCQLIGHSALRLRAMNYDESSARSRAATAEEIESMKGWVEEAMQSGAIGLSTGKNTFSQLNRLFDFVLF